MEGLGRLLFGLRQPVSQRAFIATGFGLMTLKYTVDATAIHLAAGVLWTPLDYLNPLFQDRGRKLADAPSWFLFVMALWTLPFLWIGASMSMRRAIDAGRSGWLGLVFFLPVLNYLMMLWLCVLPHVDPARLVVEERPTVVDDHLKSALFSVVAGVVIVAGLTVLSVYVNQQYGRLLFLGVPFLLGVFSAVIHNHASLKTYKSTVLVAFTALAIAACALLLFALEGVVCLVMALPLALPLTLGGATLGWALVTARRPSTTELSLALLALPLLSLFEERWTTVETFEVVTTIEVDAPPSAVWPNVIRFTELPPPEHWLFRTGIAYPLRARIEGAGVGAVRHCEFSTGAFVEPITAWIEPTRLSFDVVDQPDPMEEWSFYANVHPPHLDRSFRSVRGEFRLVALPGGRTRLEGSTWYTLDIHPAWYWRALSEPLLHAIHGRVLRHVKDLSEG
jgi:uncharacterized membrane protein YhaH (DUF805 family)